MFTSVLRLRGGDSGNAPGEHEEPRHTHVFDREVPSEKHLKSKATLGSRTKDPYGEVDKTLYSYAEGSYPSTWADIEISGNKLTVKVKKYSASYDFPYKKREL